MLLQPLSLAFQIVLMMTSSTHTGMNHRQNSRSASAARSCRDYPCPARGAAASQQLIVGHTSHLHASFQASPCLRASRCAQASAVSSRW
jgi:hypothetical protein